jgi:type II secretory pathway pseudopilin PulG
MLAGDRNGADVRDRGQAAVVVVMVVVALAALVMSGLAHFGTAVRDRTRAQAAADAAALAAIDGGAVAARRIASANGSTLVSWVDGPGPDEVTVVVRVGDAVATARATDQP